MTKHDKQTKIFYSNWAGVFEDLSDADAKRLIIALLKWTPNEDNIDDYFPIGDALRTTFRPMMEAINANTRKYEESHRKRQEAGRKGGEAKAENARRRVEESEYAPTNYYGTWDGCQMVDERTGELIQSQCYQ